MMRRAFETVAIDRLDRIGETRQHLILVLSDWLTLLPVIVPCHFVSVCLCPSYKHCVCHHVLHDLYAISILFFIHVIIALSQITFKKISHNQH